MRLGRSTIRRIAVRTGLKRPSTFEEVVTQHLRPGFFFVQIGAFDGRTGDPIHDFVECYQWAGVLVEPRRRYFDQLKQTYAERPDLILKQAAVFETAGTRTMYGLQEDSSLPDWAPQVAVFDRDVLARTKIPDWERFEEREKVACVTLQSLLDLAPGGRVDLLQIDAEGYDAAIVDMLALHRCRPSIIHFEHHALEPEVHRDTMNRLRAAGYRLFTDEKDTTAYG